MKELYRYTLSVIKYSPALVDEESVPLRTILSPAFVDEESVPLRTILSFEYSPIFS